MLMRRCKGDANINDVIMAAEALTRLACSFVYIAHSQYDVVAAAAFVRLPIGTYCRCIDETLQASSTLCWLRVVSV